MQVKIGKIIMIIKMIDVIVWWNPKLALESCKELNSLFWLSNIIELRGQIEGNKQKNSKRQLGG